ncbi:hypothetical protein M422DRAFT_191776 [Sphaerobolus stellatus SS14]|uniref:Unplaced genomic scaffold SPHSTscaffold_282, whole genome shotgun sequence n=1 Tax=Sphaerobolus stellatus (strain SS14) TaxID=990650 RepID=A0A0C9UMS9_SPHS4|nr:hypothetical protein M422DRAFT_191776 [Sphaerobolus stellatus SS14]
MTENIKIHEGEADFHVPAAGKPCKTWFKVFGDLSNGKQRPLIILHGGPGVTHEYQLALVDLVSKYGIPIVVYDQIGNGKSTHLREKNGDGSFWTEELFCDELDNLLKHLGIQDDYDLFGQSWGGMLAARFATKQPKGLNKLIISNSPASMELWVKAANKLRSQLPQEIQDTLTKHENAGTTDSKEYEEATQYFYDLHVIRLKPMPEEVQRTFESITEDPTVYMTMNGPNEFHIIGTLKSWSVVDDLHKIVAPTLLLNGRYDEAQDEVVMPYFQNISKVKWFQFSESSHLPQWEERERYMEVVGEFLIN